MQSSSVRNLKHPATLLAAEVPKRRMEPVAQWAQEVENHEGEWQDRMARSTAAELRHFHNRLLEVRCVFKLFSVVFCRFVEC